jgi:hypothetical protein
MRRATLTGLLAFESHVARGALPVVAHECAHEIAGRNTCDLRLSLSELKKTYPVVNYSFVEHEEDPYWGDGTEREPLSSVAARAAELMEFVRSRPETHIVIAAHSVILAALMNSVMVMPEEDGASSFSSSSFPSEQQQEEEEADTGWFETGEMRSFLLSWELQGNTDEAVVDTVASTQTPPRSRSSASRTTQQRVGVEAVAPVSPPARTRFKRDSPFNTSADNNPNADASPLSPGDAGVGSSLSVAAAVAAVEGSVTTISKTNRRAKQQQRNESAGTTAVTPRPPIPSATIPTAAHITGINRTPVRSLSFLLLLLLPFSCCSSFSIPTFILPCCIGLWGWFDDNDDNESDNHSFRRCRCVGRKEGEKKGEIWWRWEEGTKPCVQKEGLNVCGADALFGHHRRL